MIEIPILVATIIAITQLIKEIGLPSKYCPLVSLILGIAGGFGYIDGTASEQILTGIMMGLTASGLFDVSKIPMKTK